MNFQMLAGLLRAESPHLIGGAQNFVGQRLRLGACGRSECESQNQDAESGFKPFDQWLRLNLHFFQCNASGDWRTTLERIYRKYVALIGSKIGKLPRLGVPIAEGEDSAFEM